MLLDDAGDCSPAICLNFVPSWAGRPVVLGREFAGCDGPYDPDGRVYGDIAGHGTKPSVLGPLERSGARAGGRNSTGWW